ncbi:MAG: cyclic nucleotide-binding domain-containing protein [Gammaproteobacteria bacterium]|nr:cyclic nucleotide-binding domain-containing protein [Gammaproteobacteria bacterium]
MSEQINAAFLGRFQPLNALNPDNLQKLIKTLKLQQYPAGTTLFSKGDTVNTLYYLVKGEIDLVGDSSILKTIKSGSSDAFNCIAHILPRTVSARAHTDSVILKVDGELVDVMLTWDQTGSFQTSELESGDNTGANDWMSRILQTEAFMRIPPANIQAIFLRMESIPVVAGEHIISEGDDGDYFYAIKKGRCLVTRTMPNQTKTVKLAELHDGDMFGEEALISESKRNASVTMLTDGILNRLSKQDFLELLNEPMLNWVKYPEAQAMIDQGAKWLDVRLPAEHESEAISDSISIPLIFLRMKISNLDENTPYVVYCDTGRRSSAASFLLNERGFDTYILKDGLGSVPVEQRTGDT